MLIEMFDSNDPTSLAFAKKKSNFQEIDDVTGNAMTFLQYDFGMT